MSERNVISLQEARKKQGLECGKNAYKRYLKLLENDQLETEVNYILNTLEVKEDQQIGLAEKSSMIMDEIANRTSRTTNMAIQQMKSAIEKAKSGLNLN